MGPPGLSGVPECDASQWSSGTHQFPVRQMPHKGSNANANSRHIQAPTHQYTGAPGNVAAHRRVDLLDSEGHTAVELHKGGDTLRTFLTGLANTDSERVLTVRRINRLGLDSKTLLKPYFEKFGEVDEVMVSHTTPKSVNGSGQPHRDERRRIRPAVLGFIVMCKAEDAKAAMDYEGGNHVINGVTITAGPFQSHSIDESKKP